MIWSEDRLIQQLQNWGVEPNLAEALGECYMAEKTVSFQEGFCLTVEALLVHCTDPGRKGYIIPRLLELMHIKNNVNELHFFEVLSATAFTPVQRAQVCEDMVLIAELTNSNTNYEKAFKNMAGSGMNLLYGYEQTTETACTIMARRLNNLKNFLHSVRNYDDYENCIKIQLTGSDPHMNNKQVLIITKSDNQKIVYKPHSVRAELLVNETIKFFNQYFETHPQLGFQDLKLPVLEVETKVTPGRTRYGEIGFAEKAERISCDNAKKYYKKMGVLAFISKLLGLTDLHQENIMATKDGPVILDAECILNPGILVECNFQDTCLDMALKCGEGADGECADAAFAIGEGQSAPRSDTEFWKYRDEFCAGFFLGEVAFREIYASALTLIGKWDIDDTGMGQEPEKMRWVLIATSKLQEYLLACVYNHDHWKEEAEKECYKKLCALSKNDVFCQWNIIWEKMENVMEKSFINGDIPYFCISVTDKEVKVFCDGTEICSFNTMNKEKWLQLICENGRQTLSGGWNRYKEGFLNILLPG